MSGFSEKLSLQSASWKKNKCVILDTENNREKIEK